MLRVITDTKTPIRIWASDLEAEAEQQIRNLSQLPFLAGPVAVMPDAHAGRGSTIGTVIATRGAIIPAAVGVDIGCGMCATKLPFKLEELTKLEALRHSIERAIPVGRHGNKKISDKLLGEFRTLGSLSRSIDEMNALAQVGSLGGGNHFIEICGDEEGFAWIMLHSGSRNVGKKLADVHINHAKDLMKKYFIELPDPDLAYLAHDTKEFKEYRQDLEWAQRYAKLNREEMNRRVLEQVYRHKYGNEEWLVALSSDQMDEKLTFIDCHHNYTAMEHHNGANILVTRKGAVSARKGEYGIIPGSMGTRSFIVRGLGNEASYQSCSHGAGRRMSRTKARAYFTKEDLAAQTSGVDCRKDEGVIDEIPGAYKDIDTVMRNQADLVEIVHTLKQVICVKG